MSGACEQANGRARGPVLTPGFLSVLDHSAVVVVVVVEVVVVGVVVVKVVVFVVVSDHFITVLR